MWPPWMTFLTRQGLRVGTRMAPRNAQAQLRVGHLCQTLW